MIVETHHYAIVKLAHEPDLLGISLSRCTGPVTFVILLDRLLVLDGAVNLLDGVLLTLRRQ